MVIGGLGPDLYLGEDDTRNGRVGLSFYGGLSHIEGGGHWFLNLVRDYPVLGRVSREGFCRG